MMRAKSFKIFTFGIVRYITYCLEKVKMMKHWGVKPVLVFDGCEIPLKRGENQKRRK